MDEAVGDKTKEDDEDWDAILRDGGDSSPGKLPNLNANPGAVVAVDEEQWFLTEVVKDQKNVKVEYVLLDYMLIKGKNTFTQPSKPNLVSFQKVTCWSL